MSSDPLFEPSSEESEKDEVSEEDNERGLGKKKGPRGPPFTDEELEVLVEEMVRLEPKLLGSLSHRISATRKKQLWDFLLKKINAVSIRPRTQMEVRKRWNDTRRRIRVRIQKARVKQQKTGFGGPEKLVWKSWQKVLIEKYKLMFHKTIPGGLDVGAAPSAVHIRRMDKKSNSEVTVLGAKSTKHGATTSRLTDFSTIEKEAIPSTLHPVCRQSSTQTCPPKVEASLTTAVLNSEIPSTSGKAQKLECSKQRQFEMGPLFESDEELFNSIGTPWEEPEDKSPQRGQSSKSAQHQIERWQNALHSPIPPTPSPPCTPPPTSPNPQTTENIDCHIVQVAANARDLVKINADTQALLKKRNELAASHSRTTKLALDRAYNQRGRIAKQQNQQMILVQKEIKHLTTAVKQVANILQEMQQPSHAVTVEAKEQVTQPTIKPGGGKPNVSSFRGRVVRRRQQL